MIPIKYLYRAEVIDNDDSNHPVDSTKQSRVKIRITEYHNGISEAHLPWARPFYLSTGGSATSGVHSPPEIGSVLWVFFEKEDIKHNPFYLADVALKGSTVADKFDSTIKSSITGQEVTNWQSTYPDVKFTYYKNGITKAVSTNSNNPEILEYHPSGTFSFIDKTGKYLIKSPTGINFESGNDPLESSVLGETLLNRLESLFDELDSILTNIQALTVVVGGVPSTVPVNAAAFLANQVSLSSLKSLLSQFLSAKIKNN